MNIEYARVHYFYRSGFFRAIRVTVFLLLCAFVFFEVLEGLFPKIPLFLLNLFLMIEIFMDFKIGRTKPSVKVSDAKENDFLSAMTLPALETYVAQSTTEAFIHALMRFENVRFILEKAAIEGKEIAVQQGTKDAICTYAARLARELHGTYITTMDLFAAYLLLTEDTTKLLFSKELKPQEFVHILYWARVQYPHEEQPVKPLVHFSGEGLGELLVFGWTPETKNYTVDWTYTALEGRPHAIGRSDGYKALLEGLLKGENNNVLLVGDPGVGKESLLTTLIHDSFAGKLPSPLNHKRVLELMLGSLIAGASDRGQLEARVETIIAEISHAGNIILYIPDFQNILGSASFSLNIGDALLPYIKGGRLPIVACVTRGNYKVYVEQNPILEAFTVVVLEVPDKDTAIRMLLEKTEEIERVYGVSISYKSVVAAVEHAHTYLQDAVLPGSAVTLLTDTANTLSLSGARVPTQGKRKVLTAEAILSEVEGKTHVAVGQPNETETELLLHLEEYLHQRVIGQDIAIAAIAEAMRRVRSGLGSNSKPTSFLFLGPTGVGKTETAKALAALYFGGEEKILRFDMSEFVGDEGMRRLLGAAPGEGSERGELTDKMHDHPFSLVLLDEFEKADPRILDLFLQILDDGRLTDNKGKTVSFANAIIIATSNAGSEFIREMLHTGREQKDFHAQLLEYLQLQHLFKPELLNRFDAIVTFKPLDDMQVQQVTRLLLSALVATLKEQDITLVASDDVIAHIASRGFDKQFGARPLRRYIQDTIEDAIAKKKLANEIQRGNTVTVSIDATGALQYGVQQ